MGDGVKARLSRTVRENRGEITFMAVTAALGLAMLGLGVATGALAPWLSFTASLFVMAGSVRRLRQSKR